MSDFSRRTLVRGAAWTVPVISVAAAAPAFATSLRKDPGINGWVRAQYGTDNNFDAYFDSDPAGDDGSTPDGAPYGLYVYDVNVGPGPSYAIQDTITNATITLWFRGTVDSWSYESAGSAPNGGGHGSGWGSPTYLNTMVKPDGQTYHGYRFSYTGNLALGDNRSRVYFQDFGAQANSVNSANATFWTERRITVNGVLQTFQRRAGEDGQIYGRSGAGAKTTRTAIV